MYHECISMDKESTYQLLMSYAYVDLKLFINVIKVVKKKKETYKKCFV